MARRNLFQNIKDVEAAPTERGSPTGYVARGASRNMLSSIGELAEQAARAKELLKGAAVVELDTALLDSSFIADRMEDDEGFVELVEAMREHGQDTPILVRPHPTDASRYQIVFGHRRARAARELGRSVKAVVREVSDKEHVIAQGQENSARADLSFIERALFAQRLADQGHDRATIQLALSVDNPMLTRMLSVTGRVPEQVAVAIGPARSVGRDRWTEFAQLIEAPQSRKQAEAFIAGAEFSEHPSDRRFDLVLAELKSGARRPGRVSGPKKSTWRAPDKAVSAEFSDSGRAFALAFKSKGGADFGRFLAENLERLYGEFKQTRRD